MLILSCTFNGGIGSNFATEYKTGFKVFINIPAITPKIVPSIIGSCWFISFAIVFAKALKGEPRVTMQFCKTMLE